jgi:hypothetical protein
LTDETVKFMQAKGWIEKRDFSRPGGETHIHCFEKIEDKDVCITYEELKKIIKESTNTRTETRKISRSWSDCRPDEEEVEITSIDPKTLLENLEKFKLKKLK